MAKDGAPGRHHTPPKHKAKHARSGHIDASHRKVIKEFYGSHPDNEPDDATKKGGGPLYRKSGGSVMGGAAKPNPGRAMRKRGGRASGGCISYEGPGGRARHAKGGAALHPISHEGGTGPKGKKTIPESERVP